MSRDDYDETQRKGQRTLSLRYDPMTDIGESEPL